MRKSAIDTTRGLAVILMIATHAVDPFLDPLYKQGDLWYGLDILFGVVAPAFLFLSGAVLPAALEREWERDPRLRRTTLRMITLLLLGYWMQIPVLSLRQLIWNSSPELLARLFDANILQVIALSGLLVVALRRIVRSAEGIRVAALAIAVAVTVATPWILSSGLGAALPLPLRYYFSPQPTGTIPLFPFAAYHLFGVAAAIPIFAALDSPRRSAIVALVGSLLIATGLLLDSLLHTTPPHNDFWGTSGQHVVFRLGGVLLLVAVGIALDRLRGSAHDILCYIGRRSLPLYVVHLALIYGSPVTMGMRYWFNGVLAGAFDPWGMIGLIVGIVLLVTLAVRGWDTLRESHPRVALWTKRLAWTAFWGFFLLTP